MGISENLHWFGQSSFRLDGSKTIYFDPYQLGNNPKKASIILITHEHFDHCSLKDIKLINTNETVIITNIAAAVKLQNEKIISKAVKSLSPGDEVEISGVKIEAVASYNIDKQFHTKESKKLGFIIEVDGIKIYHAGDTDLIPEMKEIECDIALLPAGGTYTMTVDEAAKAALIMKPRLAIPMHFVDIETSSEDKKRFTDLLKGKIEVEILEEE